MFKAIVMMKRKPGISRENFIRHYEETHRVLGEKLLPMIVGYRRIYPVFGHPDNFEGHFSDGPQAQQGGDQDFDVITELSFHDQDGFAAMLAAVRDPNIGGQIAADEENFLDARNTRLFVVEEYTSNLSSRLGHEQSL